MRAKRPVLEAVEGRLLLAIEPALASVYLDADEDLIVQSAAGASGGAGGSVIVYSDRDAVSGKGNDVFVRRFNTLNQPLAAAATVNTTTANAQMSPDVAANGSGAFVVVWQSENQDGGGFGVYARAYSSAGVAQTGEVLVNQTTAGNQTSPRVGIDSSGNFVVAWLAPDSNNGDVFARRFNAAGVAQGNEFRVSGATTLAYSAPDIAVSPNGAFAVTWVLINTNTDSNTDVQLQRYNADGSIAAATVTVNTTTTADQAEPAVATVNGGYAVTWSDNSGGTGESAIYFRVFGSSSTTAAVQANQDSIGNRSRPKISADPSGNLFLGWTQQEQDATYGSVVYRAFDRTTFAGSSNESAVSDGSTVRTLFDLMPTGSGTFRDVTTVGETAGAGVASSAGYENLLRIDGTSGNDTIVAYSDGTTVRASVNGAKVDYNSLAYSRLLVDLGDGNDVLHGDGLVSIAASVSGGGGNDTIKTGASGDSISGGDGDDLVDAGSGNDYAIGNGGNDRMTGGLGDDSLTGSGGKDSLYGGFGGDRLSGSGSPDLVMGEDGDDRLYGDDGDDRLDGGGGKDNVYGGEGNDSLVGGSSNDRLYGQAGNDTLNGGAGNNYLDGDTGIDRVLNKLAGDTLISIEAS